MSVMMPRSTVIENEPAVRHVPTNPRARIQPRGYLHSKIHFDRIVAALLLVPALPVMLVLCALVKLTSRGPAIFKQTRVGRDGKLFTMYKIRSMDIHAETLTGPVWASRRDPRVTPLGRVLRKLHLDEIPQLFNVLRGDMSLVGPRPERPEFTKHLSVDIPQYEDRHLVRPGVTGLAQVNLPPDTDLEGVRRKLELDLEYIRTGSPFLDARVLMCTCFRVTGVSSARLVALMGLRRHPSNPAPAREHHHTAAKVPVKPR
jgi:lipopolysaccharide/colanic/teichoic acid biosynthesis glycosyltransferase